MRTALAAPEPPPDDEEKKKLLARFIYGLNKVRRLPTMGRYDGEDYTEDYYRDRRLESLEEENRRLKERLKESCSCIGHTMPGVRHVAPCCGQPHIDQ